MKNQKGITLIALVVTIIVLLILAGISIAMLTGDNGLLTQARRADTRTKAAEIEERVNMEMAALYADVLSGKTAFTSSDLSTLTTNLSPISSEITNTPSSISATEEEISVTVKSSSKAYSEFDTSKVTATINATDKTVTLLGLK